MLKLDTKTSTCAVSGLSFLIVLYWTFLPVLMQHLLHSFKKQKRAIYPQLVTVWVVEYTFIQPRSAQIWTEQIIIVVSFLPSPPKGCMNKLGMVSKTVHQHDRCSLGLMCGQQALFLFTVVFFFCFVFFIHLNWLLYKKATQSQNPKFTTNA